MLTGGKPLLLTLILAAGLAACGLPRDPRGTTDRVGLGVLRVGVLEHAPFATQIGGEVRGPEPELVRAVAAAMHAKPVWTVGPESRLLPALKRGDLDLVIGGFTADDPWTPSVATSQPYDKGAPVEHVLLAAPGENRWLLSLDRFLQARGQASR